MSSPHTPGGRGRSWGPPKVDRRGARAGELGLAAPDRPLFSEHRLALTIVTAIIVASSVVAMAQPFLLRTVIDVALPRQDVRLLVWLVAGMIAIAALTAVLGVVQTWISTTIGQRVMHRLRTTVFEHLQRQSLGFFTRTRSGEVQSRITNDIGGMQQVVTSTATSIASNLTTAVATAVAMVALSWRLSLISLLVMPPAIYLTRRVARMRREIVAQRQRELADLNVVIEEGPLGQRGTAEQDPRDRPRPGPAVRCVVVETDRPGAALGARGSLADGDDECDLRGDPRGDLPVRGAAGDQDRDDDRDPGRVHRAAGQPVPSADGAALRVRHAHLVARAVRADLRVPGPRRWTSPSRHSRSRSATCAATYGSTT